MPTFDVTSTVENQEVKNAVDQATREVRNRYDFKDSDTQINILKDSIELETSSTDRLRALNDLLDEKFIKRGISLKSFVREKPVEGSKSRMRQKIMIVSGIDQTKAKAIHSFIKGLNIKNVSSSTNDDLIRVTGKKRDDLQEVIQKLKEEDFDIPLQFGNFRE